MGIFSPRNKTVPLTEHLMKQSLSINFMFMDELTIRTDSFGLFKKGAYFREVAELFSADTWVSGSSKDAELLDAVGALCYPLKVTLRDGTAIVYDMDEGSAQRVLLMMKRHLGDSVQHIPMEKRTKDPIWQTGYTVMGQENFLRIYDTCVHIRKLKSMDARGSIGDVLKLGMMIAGAKKGDAHDLIIPYSDVRKVVLEPSTRFKGPLLTVLRKSRPQDSEAGFFDMNDRLDCWTFDPGDDETAKIVGAYILKRSEEC